MRCEIRKVILMAIGITLLGCVKNKSEVINKESPSKSNESIEITKYNDLQICQVTDAFFMKKINVNPSSYPTYNDDLRYFKLLKNEILKGRSHRLIGGRCQFLCLTRHPPFPAAST